MSFSHRGKCHGHDGRRARLRHDHHTISSSRTTGGGSGTIGSVALFVLLIMMTVIIPSRIITVSAQGTGPTAAATATAGGTSSVELLSDVDGAKFLCTQPSTFIAQLDTPGFQVDFPYSLIGDSGNTYTFSNCNIRTQVFVFYGGPVPTLEGICDAATNSAASFTLSTDINRRMLFTIENPKDPNLPLQVSWETSNDEPGNPAGSGAPCSFETYPNPKVIGNICRDLLPNGGGGGILGPVPDTADSVTIQVDEITSYQYFLRDYHVDDMYTYGPNEMGNTLYYQIGGFDGALLLQLYPVYYDENTQMFARLNFPTNYCLPLSGSYYCQFTPPDDKLYYLLFSNLSTSTLSSDVYEVTFQTNQPCSTTSGGGGGTTATTTCGQSILPSSGSTCGLQCCDANTNTIGIACCGVELNLQTGEAFNGISYLPSTTICDEPQAGDVTPASVCTKTSAEHDSCCSSSSYASSTTLCCDGSVLQPAGANLECCGTSTYDTTSQVCCNGNIVDGYTSTANTACCGTSPYETDTQACCDVENSLVLDGTGEDACSCVTTSGLHACDYGPNFEVTKYSICLKHYSDNDPTPPGYHFHQECVEKDKLLEVNARPGSTYGDREIYKCGCCGADIDTGIVVVDETNDNVFVKKHKDDEYCLNEDCYLGTNGDDEVCGDMEDSKVNICIAKEDGTDEETKCVDPFYSPGKGKVRVSCGSCGGGTRRKLNNNKNKGGSIRKGGRRNDRNRSSILKGM